MEKCAYCGAVYHPMPRWSRPGKIIFVCQPWYYKWKGEKYPRCEDKAAKDGYEKRLDITPKR